MKKNKLTLILFFSLIIISIFLGIIVYLCFSNTPSQVAAKFFNSLKNGNYETAYNCISTSDKKELSYSDFLEKYQLNKKTVQMMFTKSIYKAFNAKIERDVAKVSLETTSPDTKTIAQSMMAEFLPIAMAIAFSNNGDNSDKIEKLMEDRLLQVLQNDKIPFTTKNETIDAIKEDGRWYVYLNIHNKNKSDELLEKAKQYEKEKKLSSAKETYEEILKLQGNSIEAEYKIEQLEEEIGLFKEKQAYIKKLTLKDVKVFDYDEYGLGKKEKAFKGVLVNDGDKTLSEVEITVYMYDKENNIIAEEQFYPISESFIEKKKPFKPKFVKDFGWKLEKYAPTGWSGKIKVEVTDIKFQ